MLFSAVALCVVSSALAGEKVRVPDRSEVAAGEFCSVDGYKSLVQTLDVQIGPGPDCEPEPDVYGPIQFTDEATIQDVIIDVDFTHTFPSDIGMFLFYDVGCNGSNDVTVELFTGCGGDPNATGLHRFSDAASVGCSGYIGGSGCFFPESSLDALDGLDKRGCWYLQICDDALIDQGTLLSWGVHILNDGAVSVESASWGSVKAAYR
jgi:hypothetical protein